MVMPGRATLGLWAVFAVIVATPHARGQAQSPPAAPLAFNDIAWRQIGPAAFGGRIDDIEAVADNPSVIFVGTASGGVFKSVNNGITWRPVFDHDASALSIGDIAIAPSDPNVIWVGTGEANNRQSSSWGDGVYRSLDGGETWMHMGLKDTQQVGRIAIHPRDPNVVFVAAAGHLWGPNEQRGLYRTRDAGKTWSKVLNIDNDTGIGDVVIDRDGRTLFAAAYQRRRRGWGFVGGGPRGGLYRSLDGGDTWEKLGKGLPTGSVGRIGVAISRSNPDIVYTLVEHKTAGGVYRSDDRGGTWTRQSGFDPRPSYYSQIRIDPGNPDKVWVLGSLAVSLDGGKTFRSDHVADRIHTDHHALWIDPNDPDHLMLGNDGGLYFSYDGSRNWEFVDNLPIGQYYDIDIDARDPYWIYGGTQDNGTWGIPSRTSSQLGITNADVVNIAYGDGFYVAADPKDSRTIYANSQSGRTYLVDLDTREEKGLRPVPRDRNEAYRFNWSTPMLMSPLDSSVVYYGGNKLFKTSDKGHTWQTISPDLTRNQDWKKLPIMGVERDEHTLSRDDGVSDFGTITTIAESPRQAGLLYVGTDDGNVQMTRDGGKTWRNITDRFKLPGPRWVSRVIASTHDAGTAYVSFDGHQDDDFKPYVFKTTDFGSTWTSIAGDIPDGMSVHTIAEDPVKAGLLFAGTEFGLFVSTTDGRAWTHLVDGLPPVRIDDILINPRDHDIILGTHGRSIIVLDDATMLEQFGGGVAGEDVHLFPPEPATEYLRDAQPAVSRIGEVLGSQPSLRGAPDLLPQDRSAVRRLRREDPDPRQQRRTRSRAGRPRPARLQPGRVGPALSADLRAGTSGRGLVRTAQGHLRAAGPVPRQTARTRPRGRPAAAGPRGLAIAHDTGGPARALRGEPADRGAGGSLRRRRQGGRQPRTRRGRDQGQRGEPQGRSLGRCHASQDGRGRAREDAHRLPGGLRRTEIPVSRSGRAAAGLLLCPDRGADHDARPSVGPAERARHDAQPDHHAGRAAVRIGTEGQQHRAVRTEARAAAEAPVSREPAASR